MESKDNKIVEITSRRATTEPKPTASMADRLFNYAMVGVLFTPAVAIAVCVSNDQVAWYQKYENATLEEKLVMIEPKAKELLPDSSKSGMFSRNEWAYQEWQNISKTLSLRDKR